MKRTPNFFIADALKHWDSDTQLKSGAWVCARPLGRPGFNLKIRIKAAWLVFTGRADVLKWGG